MAKRYDLVIIGTGTGAMVAAMEVRAAGWSVAVIDFRLFGGTCALRGCDPKKMLVGGAEATDQARQMQGKGVAIELNTSSVSSVMLGVVIAMPVVLIAVQCSNRFRSCRERIVISPFDFSARAANATEIVAIGQWFAVESRALAATGGLRLVSNEQRYRGMINNQ